MTYTSARLSTVFCVVLSLLGFGSVLSGQTSKPASPRPTNPKPAVAAAVPQPPAGMTNADVLQMVAAKLAEDIILSAIENAPKKAFDLSAIGLVGLKNGGASDEVIRVMQGRPRTAAAGPVAEAPAAPAAIRQGPDSAPAPTQAASTPAAREEEGKRSGGAGRFLGGGLIGVFRGGKKKPEDGAGATSAPAGVQGGDWKKALKANLEAVYKPTELGRRGILDRPVSGGKPSSVVKELGTVLVVQKAGILGGGGSYGAIRQSTIRNGVLTRAFQQADEGQYLFKVGDRVYIEKLEVDDNAVVLRLWTADPVERVVRGSTNSDRYTVQVKFEFDRGVLATTDIPSLQKTIGEFLKLEAEAAAPKTIVLGQTMAEVEAILGKPTTIIDLGARKTYVYANMRIIFTDGKVSDVQ